MINRRMFDVMPSKNKIEQYVISNMEFYLVKMCNDCITNDVITEMELLQRNLKACGTYLAAGS